MSWRAAARSSPNIGAFTATAGMRRFFTFSVSSVSASPETSSATTSSGARSSTMSLSAGTSWRTCVMRSAASRT
jgi:hypothetical protein